MQLSCLYLPPGNGKCLFLFKIGDSDIVVETKNVDGVHFCTTEIYVRKEYFRMCYIRRQLMFCCHLVVDDDVRR